MAELKISVDVSELDNAIAKAERLRDILKECKELQEPVELDEIVAEPLKFSCERCCECEQCCYHPVPIFAPLKITGTDSGTCISPEKYIYYTMRSWE